MKRYETYLFDFDNTLVDSSSGYKTALFGAFEEFDIPYNRNKYNEYVRTPLSIMFAQYYPDSPQEFKKFVSIIVSTYENVYLDSVDLFPDAKECLRVLTSEERTIGIVSNSYTAQIDGILSKLGIEDMFSSVFGKDKVALSKPNPEHVLSCMYDIGASPDRTVMIGDSEMDIVAGTSAGIETILVDRAGDFIPSVLPSCIVSSLKDLI
jgi:haloacid dehalogenase superfamily, subfamily IA, variant 1 with third motif having Dx(3-4)D or Dx(3-4)E